MVLNLLELLQADLEVDIFLAVGIDDGGDKPLLAEAAGGRTAKGFALRCSE